MGVYCASCKDVADCSAHPERYLDCQDNAARFAILAAVPDMMETLGAIAAMVDSWLPAVIDAADAETFRFCSKSAHAALDKARGGECPTP